MPARRTSSRPKCRPTRRAACSRSSACRASRRATPAWPTCSRSARACSPTSCPARPAPGTCPTRARDRLVVADSLRPGGGVAARHDASRWATASPAGSAPTASASSIPTRRSISERRRRRLSLQSCMSVPLLMGESLVGVLSLYAPSANAFADDCGRLIQMVAPHIAVAIHAARRRSGEARAVSRQGRPRAAAPGRHPLARRDVRYAGAPCRRPCGPRRWTTFRR